MQTTIKTKYINEVNALRNIQLEFLPRWIENNLIIDDHERAHTNKQTNKYS